jgi:hypothetical protein
MGATFSPRTRPGFRHSSMNMRMGWSRASAAGVLAIAAAQPL